jgi:hypothetical protein
LSLNVALLLITFVHDSAPGNIAGATWYQAQLPRNALLLRQRCELHQLSLIITYVLSLLSVKLVSMLFSLGNLMAIHDYHEMFIRGVVELVVGELDIIQGAPPIGMRAKWGRYAQQCLDVTVLRSLLHVSARRHQRAPQPAKKSAHQVLIKLCQDLRERCNGNWAHHRVTHYCNGMCQGNCVARVVEAIINVLLAIIPSIPAANRWVTVGPALAWWAIGCMFHGLFPRAWVVAFGQNLADLGPNSNDADEFDDERDWTKDVQKRLGRGTEFLTNWQNRLLIILLNILLIPIDSFMQFLSSFDDASNADRPGNPLVVELVSDEGPIAVCIETLFSYLFVGSALYVQLCEWMDANVGDQAMQETFWEEWGMRCLIITLGMIASVQERILSYWTTWPWLLIHLLIETDETKRNNWCWRFWTEYSCNLNVFSKKLRGLLGHPYDLLNQSFQKLLRMMFFEGSVTTADRERSHAQHSNPAQ